mgnify:CR=1 FL=1
MDGLAKFVLDELDMINRQYARDHGITIRSKDDEDDFDPICGGCGAELTEDPPDAEFCKNCLLKSTEGNK